MGLSKNSKFVSPRTTLGGTVHRNTGHEGQFRFLNKILHFSDYTWGGNSGNAESKCSFSVDVFPKSLEFDHDEHQYQIGDIHRNQLLSFYDVRSEALYSGVKD